MLVFSDRAHENHSVPALLVRFNQLVDRRLRVTRKGIEELRNHMAAGRRQEAEMILGKVDEDLLMLSQRLERELETAVPRSCVLQGLASTAN